MCPPLETRVKIVVYHVLLHPECAWVRSMRTLTPYSFGVQKMPCPVSCMLLNFTIWTWRSMGWAKQNDDELEYFPKTYQTLSRPTTRRRGSRTGCSLTTTVLAFFEKSSRRRWDDETTSAHHLPTLSYPRWCNHLLFPQLGAHRTIRYPPPNLHPLHPGQGV